MQEILTALAEQHAELAGLLDGLDAAGWRRPTRCEGWDISDVVLHLAQTDEFAVASVRDDFPDTVQVLADGLETRGNVDDGAAALVEHERGLPDDELRERWRAGATTLRDLLAANDPHKRVRWVAGRLSIHTLTATRLAECWIHTGDVAEGLGRQQELTDRLEHVARLAWRTLPYAFARGGRELTGPVEFDLKAPSGARWHFVPEAKPITRVEGAGTDLCLVAARRVAPEETTLRASGPDAAAVLDLVRTYA